MLNIVDTKRLIILLAFAASLLFTLPVISADRVDINAASAEVLEVLPGIGPAKAQAIVDYRKENGKFAAEDQIQNVPGIGAGTWEKIKDLIVVNKT